MRRQVLTRWRVIQCALALVIALAVVPVVVAAGSGPAGATGQVCATGQPSSGDQLVSISLGQAAPGGELQPGQCLMSPDSLYQLVMQSDGNLVLYSAAGPLWAAGTTANPGAYLIDQGGNLIVYPSSGPALWASNTGYSNGTAVLQDDGNFVLYSQSGTPLWSTNTAGGGVSPNQGGGTVGPEPSCVGTQLTQPLGGDPIYLNRGTELCVTNAGGPNYVLVMQNDGNLVEYKTTSSGSEPIWASTTSGQSSTSAQLNGCDLIVGTWQTNHSGSQKNENGQVDGTQLTLQSDGNVLVQCDTGSGFSTFGQWQSGTNGSNYTLLLAPSCPPGSAAVCQTTLKSPNNTYQLSMQSDGNLVLTRVSSGIVLWSTGTANNPGAVAVMQDDGNFVVYSNTQGSSGSSPTALWASGTQATNPVLSLGADGNLVIWGSNGGDSYAAWASHTGNVIGDALASGGVLQPGQAIDSANGEFRLLMGTNGAAQIVQNNTPGGQNNSCPIWSAPGVLTTGSTVGYNPATQNGAYLQLNQAGELVLWAPGQSSGTPIWSSGVTGAASVGLQNDGNLVEYSSSGTPIWSSGTNGTSTMGMLCTNMELSAVSPVSGSYVPNGSYVLSQVQTDPFTNVLLVMQSDCNLVLYQYNQPIWSSGTNKGYNGAPAGNTPGSPYYGCYAVMQSDGNLVIYVPNGGGALWASGTNQSTTNAGAPPAPGPYVTLVRPGTQVSKSQCNGTGYSTGCFDSNNSVNLFVATSTGEVLGTPSVLSTPFESAGTAANQIVSAIGFVFRYVGNYWTSPAAAAANLFWGALGSFARPDCPVNGSCAGGPSVSTNITGCTNQSPPLLAEGGNLLSGGCLISANRQYDLIMQTDGNLVLYFNQGPGATCLSYNTVCIPLWSTGTNGNPGAYLSLQGGAHLFVYSSTGAPLYNGPSASVFDSSMVVQDDGNVVDYGNIAQGVNATPYAAWSLGTNSNRGSTLYSGEVLEPAQTLTAANGGVNPGGPFWTEPPVYSIGSSGVSYNVSNIPPVAGAYLVMQTDGNLVLYPPNRGSAIWSSNTGGNPGAIAQLGSNGQLAVYNSNGQLIWSEFQGLYPAGTSQAGAQFNDRGAMLCTGGTLQPGQLLSGLPGNYNSYFPQLVMQTDCNLVQYDNGQAQWSSGTNGKGSGCYAYQENNGCLVVRNPNGDVLWASPCSNAITDVKSATGPYITLFSAGSGNSNGIYTAQGVDQLSGDQVWYNKTSENKDLPTAFGDIPGWVNTLIGIIAAFAF
jgi:hypothetical protein